MATYNRKGQIAEAIDVALRDVLERLAQGLRPQPEPEADRTADISRRIALSKPTIFTGVGEPVMLEAWLREFDKLFSIIGCPSEHQVDQAAYYLADGADFWWRHARAGLVARAGGYLSWEEFKRAIRAKYYPPHLRKQKSNEFARLEMGAKTVEEYYLKFMEYSMYCPEDVSTEERKMQRFELGLSLEIRKLIDFERYDTLDDLYQRAAQVGSLIKEERAVKRISEQPWSGDKRKEHPTNLPENFKRNRGFERNKQDGGENFGRFRGYDKEGGKDRHFYCRRCHKDHPGTDCEGKPVQCFRCGKMGHRGYECYSKSGQGGDGRGFDAGRSGRSGGSGGSDGGFTNRQEEKFDQRQQNSGGYRQNQGNFNKSQQNFGKVSALSLQDTVNTDVVTGKFTVNIKP